MRHALKTVHIIQPYYLANDGSGRRSITQDNWEDRAVKVCGDPANDMYRAVIFPPTYQSVMENRLPNGRYENDPIPLYEWFVFFSNEELSIRKRISPSLYHPRVKREISQYVGYTNQQGDLLNEYGQKISFEVDLEDAWEGIETFQVTNSSSDILPIQMSLNREENLRTAIQTLKGKSVCSYISLPSVYQTRLVTEDLSYRELACEGSQIKFELSALKPRTRKHRDRILPWQMVVKDHQGHIQEYNASSLFQDVDSKSVCTFKQIK